jgi:hypothetical protein
MLKRLKASLSQPKSLFTYKDDRKRIVFLYTIFVLVFAMIPYVIIEITQGTFDAQMTLAVKEAFQADVMQKNNEIVNGQLISEEPFDTVVDFNVFTNDPTINTFYLVIFFSETHLQIKLGNEVVEEVSYMNVLPNFDFRDDSIENTSLLMTTIKNFINDSTFVSVLMLGSVFFSLTLDYLIVTFLLVLLMQMNRQVSPLSFKTKYKIGLYMSTPYIFSTLILVLFGLGNFTFISLFIGYAYYVWAYRLSGGNRAQV